MSTTCRDLDDVLELIATGEMTPNAAMATHLAACARCTGRLTLARQVDNWLASTEVPNVPDNFVSMVFRRLRREWWRTEQHLDLWFNVALGGGLMLVVAGIWLLLNVSGLTVVARDASGLLITGLRALTDRIVLSLPVYGAATAIVVTALGVWWWAEQEQAV